LEGKLKMEIPIEHATADLTTAKVVLEAQALEIRELQAVIARLREEGQMLAHTIATGKALK